MKASDITAPGRGLARALSPNNLANSLVEGGYRVGNAAGATVMGVLGAAGGIAATAAVFEKLNPVTTVQNSIADFQNAQSLGSKTGAILGGAGELAIDVAVPLMTLVFTFESIDAAAQAWDKPQNRIDIEK